MAIPPSLSNRLLWYLLRPKQPSHPMAHPHDQSGHEIPPHYTIYQPRPLALSLSSPFVSLRYLPPQMHFLFRSCQKGVLPPHSNQLLLRSMGRLHVLSHQCTPYSSPRATPPGHMVRLHGTVFSTRAQNLWPVAFRGKEEAL